MLGRKEAESCQSLCAVESGSSVLMFPVEELACVGQGSARSGSRDLLRPQERKEREPSCQGSARGRPTFPDAQPLCCRV